MKGNFFEGFKEYLLSRHKDNIKTFIPYYETLKQIEVSLKELIDDTEKYHWDIDYDADKTGGYTNGIFTVNLYNEDPSNDYGWQSILDHEYKIDLLTDERYWGYCVCTPEMKGYDPVHRCCGDGCDWIAPSIYVTKIRKVASHSFDGVERDMWKLEREWIKEGIDHDEELKKRRLQEIEEELERLKNEKLRLLNT
ncbi:hypothetical protein [Siminovitchia sp. 179-K 8D1 HS]|uniref:hypothetical protein n=1 Tax=Siminovitchia sp. 179-K 8D1 HS TaxID=3142385 RepID=UPI0039A0A3C1